MKLKLLSIGVNVLLLNQMRKVVVNLVRRAIPKSSDRRPNSHPTSITNISSSSSSSPSSSTTAIKDTATTTEIQTVLTVASLACALYTPSRPTPSAQPLTCGAKWLCLGGAGPRLDLRVVWLPVTAIPRHVAVRKYLQWPMHIPRCVVTAAFSCQCVGPTLKRTPFSWSSPGSPGSASHGSPIVITHTIAPKSGITDTDTADFVNGIQVDFGRSYHACNEPVPFSSIYGAQSTATAPQNYPDLSHFADVLSASDDITASDDDDISSSGSESFTTIFLLTAEAQLLVSHGYQNGTHDIIEHHTPHNRHIPHVLKRIPSEHSQTGSDVTAITISSSDGSSNSDTPPPYPSGTVLTNDCATPVGPLSSMALPHSACTTHWDECALSDGVGNDANKQTKSMESDSGPSNSRWSIKSAWCRASGAMGNLRKTVPKAFKNLFR